MAKWNGMNWIRIERRRALYIRDGYRCVYCGAQSDRLTLDHVFPRSLGGSNGNENLVTACGGALGCNVAKATLTLEAFAKTLPDPKGVLGRVRVAASTEVDLVAGMESALATYEARGRKKAAADLRKRLEARREVSKISKKPSKRSA